MRAALAIAGVVAATATARADVPLICSPTGDPTHVGLRDATFDVGRSACLRSTLSAHVVGVAVIDTPEFYGTLGGGLVLGARYRRGRRLELGLAVRAVDYSFAQDAVIKSTELRLGPVIASVATGGAIAMRVPARWAVVGTAVVPYTTDDMDTVAAAAQVAAIASFEPVARWAVHLRAAVLAAAARSAGGTTRRAAFLTGIDAAHALTGRIGLGLGVDAQAGWRGAFDHFLIRAGMHVRITSRWHLELGAGFPAGGRERADAAIVLGIARAYVP